MAILTTSLISYEKNKNSNTSTETTGNVILNMKEISKHSSPSDCWFVVDSKVYNVTKAISAHPGGASEIIKYCGQEATQAWKTKDIGSPHSNRANSELTSFYIGDLNQTITRQQIQQTIQKTNSVVPTLGEEDD